MNIFFLHECPKKAGRDLIDHHIRKMIVENCQLMANCYDEKVLFNEAPRTDKGTARKHSQYNNMCAKWVRKCNLHFDWILQNAITIEQEYRRRFGKLHFCRDFINWCMNNPPNLPRLGTLEDPPLNMPAKYKIYNGAVECYREYYRQEKKFTKNGKPMFLWTNKETPTWIQESPVPKVIAQTQPQTPTQLQPQPSIPASLANTLTKHLTPQELQELAKEINQHIQSLVQATTSPVI